MSCYVIGLAGMPPATRLPNSCFSVCDVLTFCDETAWKIVVIVAYILRIFLFRDVWSKFQMCKELINIVLLCEYAHTKWRVVDSLEWSAMTSGSKTWIS